MEHVLTASGLTKDYRGFRALDGLSLHVPKGSIYGLVGRNGAGKTTLIRILCGLQSHTAGEYAIYGVDSGEKGIAEARRRLGAMIEGPAVYQELTGAENLALQYRVLGRRDFNTIPDLLKLVGLENLSLIHI